MDPQWNVYDTDENTSVRVILINNSPAQHPMHLHGHNMYLLAEGYGSWNGTVVNPSNPQRRDTLQSVACIFDAKFNCVPGGLSYNGEHDHSYHSFQNLLTHPPQSFKSMPITLESGHFTATSLGTWLLVFTLTYWSDL
jgi:hypothetical protein